jgi:hypothetical protein
VQKMQKAEKLVALEAEQFYGNLLTGQQHIYTH